MESKGLSFEILEGMGIEGTCSISNPKDYHAALAKNPFWFGKALSCGRTIVVFTHVKDKEINSQAARNIGSIKAIFSSENPEYDFIRFHNYINRRRNPVDNIVGENCSIHSTAVIGIEGMTYAKRGKDVVKLKHIGNVVLGNNVDIGAYSAIARGSLDSTIVEDNVKIGCHCSIGHNSVIGEGTIITDCSMTAGSAIVGKNCYLCVGSIIRRVKICDNVLIGMGSVVVKDIEEPGVYFGNPATRKGDWDGKWI